MIKINIIEINTKRVNMIDDVWNSCIFNYHYISGRLGLIYTVTRKSFEHIANFRIFQILHDR